MMSCSFLSFQRWKAHIRFNQNVTPCNNDCSRPTQETFIDGIVPATSGCLGGWVIPISDCFNHTFNDFHEPEYVQTIHERKDDKVRDLRGAQKKGMRWRAAKSGARARHTVCGLDSSVG
eukprot:scaffold9920_cov32-Tisochrysis_lutea.AAC.4